MTGDATPQQIIAYWVGESKATSVLAALEAAGYQVARLERVASLSRMCLSCDRAAMDGVPPDPCPTGSCRAPESLFRKVEP